MQISSKLASGMQTLHQLLTKYELTEFKGLADDYLSAQVAIWLAAEIEPVLAQRQEAIEGFEQQVEQAEQAVEEARHEVEALATMLKEASRQTEGDNELTLQYEHSLQIAEQKTIIWRNLEYWLEDLTAQRALMEQFLDELKAIEAPKKEQIRQALLTAWPPVPVFNPTDDKNR